MNKRFLGCVAALATLTAQPAWSIDDLLSRLRRPSDAPEFRVDHDWPKPLPKRPSAIPAP